jgi:hypothetical protein
VEGDNFLRPKLTAVFSQRKGKSRLALTIVFQRRSALFQLNLGLLLRVVASQQLGQSLLVLQLFNNNM